MLIGSRSGFMARKRLPYDKEVAYLESTGTQWIDTGVVFQYDWSTTLSMEADVQFKSSTSRYLFGSNGWGYWGKNTSNKYESGGFGGGGLTNLPSLDALGRHTVRWTFIGTGTAHRNEFSYDGENYVGATTAQDTAPQYVYPVILFGIGNRNTPQPSFLSMALLWRCSIYKNDQLVRDFIPVRIGAVGYMYDKVGGGMYGNAGSGEFMLGPDARKKKWGG